MPILDWLNKDEAVKKAQQVPYRLLEPVPELSYGDPASENMLIQGDNLEALKALIPMYAGQVKCIYIDPPYNTRSAFEHYDDNLGHSQWLSMIYPRLELLRDLLADTASIWVSIDDGEAQYLKVVMDEIFGRANFITSFIWQKVDSPNTNTVPIAPDHEYVLVYAKTRERVALKQKGDESILKAYPNIDETGRRYRDRLLKKNGKESLRHDRPKMFYPIPGPDGVDVLPIHDDGREARWSYGKDTVFSMLDQLVWKRRTVNGKEGWVPYTREFAPEDPKRPHPTILLDVLTSRQAKAHQRQLFGDIPLFDTVKPENLVQRVLEIATEPGDLVLDSFLGSGTTAAVALKMNRSFIGIEMGEHAITHCRPRAVHVVDGEPGGISEAMEWEGGNGFHFYRLGALVFDEFGAIRPDIRFQELAAHVWYLETRTPYLKKRKSPLLGVHNGTAYYLLYNGILGDRRPQGGNVLTGAVLAELPKHDGPRVIYGETTRLGAGRLAAERITFKQIPYDVRAR